MAYTKTTWVNGTTALSADNMNHIETGIKDAHDDIAEIKSDIDSNEFDSKITIPFTLSMSNKMKTFDYAFPSDGYLLIGNNSEWSTLPSMSWDLALKGSDGSGSIPIVTLLRYRGMYYYNGSATDYANYGKALIPVKKGMKLVGDFYVNLESAAANFIADFYPFA